MNRIDHNTEISESASDLLSLERAQSHARFRDYVRFIRYLKLGEAQSQVASCAKIGLQSRIFSASLSRIEPC